MAVALLCGWYPAVIVGLSPFLGLALGSAVLVAFVWIYGRRPERASECGPGAADPVDSPDSKGARGPFGARLFNS